MVNEIHRFRVKGSWFMVKGSSLGHTEITDNTEILGFKFQDSSFKSRRERRERRNKKRAPSVDETLF